jgi:hypothetical protein
MFSVAERAKSQDAFHANAEILEEHPFPTANSTPNDHVFMKAAGETPTHET